MALPVSLTLLITKTAAKTTRLLGKGGGTALPGLWAERLDPQLARKLASNLPHGVILVTGTNGKTTATKLLAAALEAKGEHVITNRAGSNLKRGVVSALIGASDLRGRMKATVGLFEVDEASLRRIAPLVLPRQIVVLNLFRDQLDRYGELDTTAALIGEGIQATEADLHLNADDPMVASLARYARSQDKVHYFGVAGLPADLTGSDRGAIDSDRCPVCNERLEFSRVFYAHIGHYACPNGHFDRPQPQVVVTSLEQAGLDGSRFEVSIAGKRSQVELALPGVYNLYNALAAISAATTSGVPLDEIKQVLASTAAAFGRVERVDWRGRQLYLLLIKNPIGFAQVMQTFVSGQSAPVLMMAINDLYADGRDVSWLWDVPLEQLLPTGATVIATGERGADMALRLKYADHKAELEPDLAATLDRLAEALPEGGTGYILPTYTAMLQLRRLLGTESRLEEVWK